MGAKTVLIPEMEVSGLGDYDRDNGFVKGTIAVSAQPHVLAMDRGRSFQLDREDNDETGIADLAGQVMGEFVRTQVVPEMDAYILSKLAAHAVSKSQTVTGTPASQAYKMMTRRGGQGAERGGLRRGAGGLCQQRHVDGPPVHRRALPAAGGKRLPQGRAEHPGCSPSTGWPSCRCRTTG